MFVAMLCACVGAYAVPRCEIRTFDDFTAGVREINKVMEDEFGYIWLATSNGLYRYDGYDFVNFPFRNVKKLYKNFNGDFWCLVDDRAYVFDHKEYKYIDTGVSNYISGDELRKSGYRTVIESLQGRVPGLNITGGGGNGAARDVSMRGTRSITDSGMPVLVLNGMVVPDFDGISLNDVDYVEVLKEAGIYGAGGSNGAIIVHTK